MQDKKLVSPSAAGRLRECHQRSNLTVAKMSDLTGIPRAVIEDLTQNARPLSGVEWSRLARTYGTTSEWLQEGRPHINIWDDFRHSPEFLKVNHFNSEPSERIRVVLQWVERAYPGHMRLVDYLMYLPGVFSSVDEFLYCIHQNRLTEGLIRHLSQLWGIPKSWIWLGDAWGKSDS